MQQRRKSISTAYHTAFYRENFKLNMELLQATEKTLEWIQETRKMYNHSEGNFHGQSLIMQL